MSGCVGVAIRLGGDWDSPRRGVQNGTGIYAGLGRGWDWLLVVPLGLGGGWEYPVRWLMGSGTVQGFIPGFDWIR